MEPMILLCAVNDDVICSLDGTGLNPSDAFAQAFGAACSRSGHIYLFYPAFAHASGDPESARGLEVVSGDALWRESEESGAVFDSGLLCGDDIEDTFHIYVFDAADLRRLIDEEPLLYMNARAYCDDLGISY